MYFTSKSYSLLGFLSSFIPKVAAVDLGGPITGVRYISTNTSPLFVRVTTCLYAEPLKKKKRIDPAILKQREERRKKKLEKQIRRLEKNARQLKPIDELEIPLSLVHEREQRKRIVTPPSKEVLEQRVLLVKHWTAYKTKQAVYNAQQIDRMLQTQQKALDELRNESEELYQDAIQFDPSLIPFKARGPTLMPPIKDYDSPDGEYMDITKKWEILPGESK